MFIIRRVAKTKPGKAWEVAGYLSKICKAYEEETGRNQAVVYLQDRNLPGTPDVVYAQWTQDTIEDLPFEKVPKVVLETHPKMMQHLDDYSIELYQVVTPKQLDSRGFG